MCMCDILRPSRAHAHARPRRCCGLRRFSAAPRQQRTTLYRLPPGVDRRLSSQWENVAKSEKKGQKVWRDGGKYLPLWPSPRKPLAAPGEWQKKNYSLSRASTRSRASERKSRAPCRRRRRAPGSREKLRAVKINVISRTKN